MAKLRNPFNLQQQLPQQGPDQMNQPAGGDPFSIPQLPGPPMPSMPGPNVQMRAPNAPAVANAPAEMMNPFASGGSTPAPSLPPTPMTPPSYGTLGEPTDEGDPGPGPNPAPPLPPPNAPPAPGGGGSFDDFVRNYWAPDRREVLVAMLRRDYWAPDREAVIKHYETMPDSELWPNGKPGGGGTDDADKMKSWSTDQWRDWFLNFVSGKPANPAALGAMEGELNKVGIKVLRNASGQISGKIQLPNGVVVDVGRAFGAGGGGPDYWQWLLGGGGGDSGGPPAPAPPPYSGDSPWLEYIKKILAQGYGADPHRLMLGFEKEREFMEKGKNAALGSLQAQLAERGLLGAPGTESGAASSSYARLGENISNEFASNLRDLQLSEDKIAQDRYMNALQMALQRDASGETNAVNYALGVLNNNRAWNQFLAQLGLDRDRLNYEIQNGNQNAINQLLQLFAEFMRNAAGGAQ